MAGNRSSPTDLATLPDAPTVQADNAARNISVGKASRTQRQIAPRPASTEPTVIIRHVYSIVAASLRTSSPSVRWHTIRQSQFNGTHRQTRVLARLLAA